MIPSTGACPDSCRGRPNRVVPTSLLRQIPSPSGNASMSVLIVYSRPKECWLTQRKRSILSEFLSPVDAVHRRKDTQKHRFPCLFSSFRSIRPNSRGIASGHDYLDSVSDVFRIIMSGPAQTTSGVNASADQEAVRDSDILRLKRYQWCRHHTRSSEFKKVCQPLLSTTNGRGCRLNVPAHHCSRLQRLRRSARASLQVLK